MTRIATGIFQDCFPSSPKRGTTKQQIRCCGTANEGRALRDFEEHAPSRSDGFMVPAGDNGVFDPRVAALLSLADRAPSPEPALLLHNFLGSFLCCKCGT